MLNEAQISLTGYVATQPVTKTFETGAMNLSMRVAWTPRRLDRVTGEWVDGNTSYITVICWRKLASNVAVCVRKGDPVVVTGRLSVRPYNGKEGVPRTAVEVEASSVGHDLSRGVASFQRVRPQTGLTASEFAAQGGQQADGLDARSAMSGASAAGDWTGSGQHGIPMPQEPTEEFFDESAIDDELDDSMEEAIDGAITGASREPEPAAVRS